MCSLFHPQTGGARHREGGESPVVCTLCCKPVLFAPDVPAHSVPGLRGQDRSVSWDLHTGQYGRGKLPQ